MARLLLRRTRYASLSRDDAGGCAEQTVPGRHSKKIEALASLGGRRPSAARDRVVDRMQQEAEQACPSWAGRTLAALPTEHGRELLQPLKPPALPKRLAALPPGPLGAQFDASPVRFDGTTAEKVQQEVDMQGQMQRRLQLQLKQSHAALAQERLQTVRAKKLGDHALAQAERSQEQALEQARVQREAAEKRLARQMGAQRRMLEKDMEQRRRRRSAESAAKGRRALLERLREKDEQLREAHAELERARDRVRRGVCEHSRMNGQAVPVVSQLSSYSPPPPTDRYKRRLSTPCAPLRRRRQSTKPTRKSSAS